MAEVEEQEELDETEEEESSPPNRKALLFGGGAVSILAAGVIAAMMAVPSVEEDPIMVGPFTMSLFGDEQFSCNIKVQGRSRFLQMRPEIYYYAYDKGYLEVRTKDELYPPALYSEVFRVATTRDTDEIYGEVDKQTFMEELRDAIDPVLFPVHIGETALPWDIDGKSGLRPGLTSEKNTFRGHFHDHDLHVNAAEKTLQIDDGPEAAFETGDQNVKLLTVEGAVVFVDTSSLGPEFVGTVPIGIRGKIVRILPTGLLLQ